MTAGDRPTEVYTDGGASPNPGPGGWGVVLLRPGAEPVELSGGEAHTTNNRMELTAAIRAVEALAPVEAARLHVDSQYVRQGITAWLPAWIRRGWRKADGKPVENEDLWRRLWELASGRRLEWRWVRGHAGDRWNERADRLAAAEIRRLHGGPHGAAARDGAAEPAEWEVHLRVSADGREGGWAAAVRGPGDEPAAGAGRVLTGADSGLTGNRLEILAAAEVLESLPPAATVDFHTPSDYLRHGASRWLPGWRRRGWVKKDGGPVAHRDAWERLAAALARRTVRWPDPRGEEEHRSGAAELEKAARASRKAADRR